MPTKRYSVEQIVAKLREAEKLHGQGLTIAQVWNRPAAGPNDVWSYDFMSGRTRQGGPIRILNVVDEYTRVAVGCRVARSIGARDVIAELARLFEEHVAGLGPSIEMDQTQSPGSCRSGLRS